MVALVLSRLDSANAVLPCGLPDSSSSVCHERLSTDNPPTTQLRPHNRRTDQSPLASRPRAYSVQGRSPRVQSASWTRATVSRTTDSVSNLPGRRVIRSACTNQLDIPFVRLSTVGGRSGIRRCWPANLEQSASSCDLSRDSCHVQTETQNISV